MSTCRRLTRTGGSPAPTSGTTRSRRCGRRVFIASCIIQSCGRPTWAQTGRRSAVLPTPRRRRTVRPRDGGADRRCCRSRRFGINMRCVHANSTASTVTLERLRSSSSEAFLNPETVLAPASPNRAYAINTQRASCRGARQTPLRRNHPASHIEPSPCVVPGSFLAARSPPPHVAHVGSRCVCLCVYVCVCLVYDVRSPCVGHAGILRPHRPVVSKRTAASDAGSSEPTRG